MGQRKLNATEIVAIIEDVKFPNYTFTLTFQSEDKYYLQASYYDADVITGKYELQKTRKWYISPFMTKSEIVQTAFKCALTSFEHRTREYFLYKNQRVFSPHYDVEALVELCEQKRFDEREDWYSEEK